MKTYAGKNTLNILKKKIAKNIGLLYKAKPYIDKHSLLPLYHSHLHSYINYGNIAWGSTSRANLKKIYSQQKHAILTVHSKVHVYLQNGKTIKRKRKQTLDFLLRSAQNCKICIFLDNLRTITQEGDMETRK